VPGPEQDPEQLGQVTGPNWLEGLEFRELAPGYTIVDASIHFMLMGPDGSLNWVSRRSGGLNSMTTLGLCVDFQARSIQDSLHSYDDPEA
jgi:hypothetical protein